MVGTSTEAVGIGGLIINGLVGGGAASTEKVVFTGGGVKGREWSGVCLRIALGVSLSVRIRV